MFDCTNANCIFKNNKINIKIPWWDNPDDKYHKTFWYDPEPYNKYCQYKDCRDNRFSGKICELLDVMLNIPDNEITSLRYSDNLITRIEFIIKKHLLMYGIKDIYRPRPYTII
jgi:hypothetical protein